jgi:hypothetical protein
MVLPIVSAADYPFRSAGNRKDASGRRIAWASLILIGTLAVAPESSGQGQPATAVEQYQALRKEYDIATGSGVPLSDAERLRFVGRVYRHHYAVAEKFLKLAEKYPTIQSHWIA